MNTQSRPTLPTPLVRNAITLQTDKGPSNAIDLNSEITLELPAINDPSCTFVILALGSTDGNHNVQLIGSAPIVQGQPTVITLSNKTDDQSPAFKSGHEATITGSVQVTGLDHWVDTPISEIYGFKS
ncbi:MULTISPECIES: hypothetical protein [Pseudomonas syringae group]|uniref:DUF5666 domain-containing protein n=2 Tax=Pseudomonas syringae group TaxID=136849 RepID=A0ABX6H973_9PSED|nr:hypothetical protein [Pseudomonas asturiensis]QHF01968.1 hypothetical protein N015_05920 [Pseudomonas asturiensis]